MENEEAEYEVPEFPVVSEEKPVYMHKSGEPVVVGHCVVTRHEDRTEIDVVLDTDNGNQVGSMLVTNMMTGVSIGGVLDPDVAQALKAKLN